MSNTGLSRSLYDGDVKKVDESQSGQPLNLTIDLNAHENCEVCDQGDGKTNVLEFGELIETENDLTNRDRIASRNPDKKYQKPDNMGENSHNVPYLCERSLSGPWLENERHKEVEESNRIISEL